MEDDRHTEADIDGLSKELLDWIQCQNFPPRKDNRIVKKFLAGSKYRLETAKSKLRNFYKLRQSNPLWFQDRNPKESKIQDLIQFGLVFPLPTKGVDGIPIMVVKPCYLDAYTYPLDLRFKVSLILADIIIDMFDDIVEKGVHVIFDCEGIGLSHVTQVTYRHLWLIMQMWQNIYPMRIKSIHIINCPYFVNALITVFKTLLNGKLRRRLLNHGTHKEALAEYFSLDVLPNEYSGKWGPMDDILSKWTDTVNSKAKDIVNGNLYCGQ